MPSLKQIEVEGGDLSTGTIGNDASGGGGEAKAASRRRKEDDDDDVDIMGVATFDQQLARRKENAEKNGDMLNLCNDSDTEDTKSSAVKVKTEQTGSAEDTKSFAVEKKRKAPTKSNESMEVDSTVKVKTEQTQTESKKKKRKQSILEMMNPDYVGKTDEKDVDSEKENNSKPKKEKAAKSSSTKSSKKKKPKSGADIRSFYSLSPKAESSAKSPMADCSAAKTPDDTTPKKRKQVGKFIGLNDDAKPIHIHIPFVGDDKNTAVTIDAHCVESKYDLSSPIVLTGKYSSRRRTKFQIESFLGGFGRYIH